MYWGQGKRTYPDQISAENLAGEIRQGYGIYQKSQLERKAGGISEACY